VARGSLTEAADSVAQSGRCGRSERTAQTGGAPATIRPMTSLPDRPLRQFAVHSRHWRENLYVYPVVSRRSRGISIGINLNPDAACNFDCIYCQVDRSVTPRVRNVDPALLEAELDAMVRTVLEGRLFDDPGFVDVPQAMRRLNDFAFSGDGEPTTCPLFPQCVRIAAAVKNRHGLSDVRLVLITDAAYLDRPKVVQGLDLLDRHQGEIWAKLDAGTEEYYQLVNRPNVPLARIVSNVAAAARVRPVVIQSLFMRIDGAPPPAAEIEAFCGRLSDIVASGGRISCVQAYTIARPPAQPFVTALSQGKLDDIADRIAARTALRVERFYAS